MIHFEDTRHMFNKMNTDPGLYKEDINLLKKDIYVRDLNTQLNNKCKKAIYDIDTSHCLSPKNTLQLKMLSDKLHVQFTQQIRSNEVRNRWKQYGKISKPILVSENEYLKVYKYTTSCLKWLGINIISINTDDFAILRPGDFGYYKYWNPDFLINLYKAIINLKGREIVFYDSGVLENLLRIPYAQSLVGFFKSMKIQENDYNVISNLERSKETYRLYLDCEKESKPICSTKFTYRDVEEDCYSIIIPYTNDNLHNQIHHLVFSNILDQTEYYYDICNEEECDLERFNSYITLHKGVNLHKPTVDYTYTSLPKNIQYYQCEVLGHVHPILHPQINVENFVTKCGNASSSSNSKAMTLSTNTTYTRELHHRSSEKSGKKTFDGILKANGRMKVIEQGNRHGYHAVGYKIARCDTGYCIVKLGMFEESLFAHEDDKKFTFEGKTLTQSVYRSSKFRTNLCIVLGIIPIKFNKGKLNIIQHLPESDPKPQSAKSCIYANNFKYNLGEMIYVTVFDSNYSSVCLPGIHFFFDLNIAVCMFHYDTVGIDNNTRRYIEDYVFYGDDTNTYNSIKTCASELISNYKSIGENLDIKVKIVNNIGSYVIDKNEKCSICFDNYKLDNISTLPCGHIFCYECIDDWLKCGNNSCPMCRFPINVSTQSTNRDTRRITFQ